MLRNKVEIVTQSGERLPAEAPVIVSASRATDLPAFYTDWFFRRLEQGHAARINPFNGRKSYVSFARTQLVVFWSKNPRPLLPRLPELRARGIRSYVQFTLNDYRAEGLEPGVPPLDERIDTFRALAETLGKGRVVWRFDPLILTDRIGVDDLLRKIASVGERLQGYTDKLVFSFADIGTYRKVERNLSGNGIRYREFSTEEMEALAEGLARRNERWGFELAACGERIDLGRYGIARNKCIDDALIVRNFADDPMLMEYMHANGGACDLFGGAGSSATTGHCRKDRAQRPFCGCIPSRDIGCYGTCPHGCVYCYANSSAAQASARYRAHLARPDAESLHG